MQKLCLLLVALVGLAPAALITNPGQAITQQVTVQIIQTQLGPPASGSAATVFGDAAQRASIEAMVDLIWAQAGIDVLFLPATNLWVNSFAYEGTAGSNDPRPDTDLNTMVTQGILNGVANANPLVINMYFVNIVPGFSFTSANTVNGLAYVGGNGIAAFVGSNLLGFLGGREAIASVIAHEIGHNLGLDHLVEAENLMQSGGSPNQGERLNSAQIQAALNSPLSTDLVAVPEPGTGVLVSVVLLVAAGLRNGRGRRFGRCAGN